jgi:hypothetical protein
MAYGGIRAPDTEIVYRVAESFVDRGAWDVRGDLEGWPPGFGTAPGRDGRRWAVYGPGQSLAIAPLVPLARALAATGWWRWLDPPASHFVGRGVECFVLGERAPDPAPHAARAAVAWAEILAGVALVVVFRALAERLLPGAARGPLFAAALLAFGTFVLGYAGTLFAEPLATLLFLSGLCLLAGPLAGSPPHRRSVRLALAGICLGAAVLVHATMILFAPFVAGWLVWTRWRAAGPRPAAADAAWLLGGLAVPLAALAAFNGLRFGDVLETGRNLSPFNRVVFRPPWTALYWVQLFRLLFGSGKGLVCVVPAVLWGAACWRHLHRQHPELSWMLGAACGFRTLITAAYGDWHAGFGLGPRYLYPIVPLLVLPVAFWAEARLARRARLPAAAVGALWACTAQQLYFAMGEIFSFYHILNWQHLARGVNLFQNDALYVDWRLSPLYRLLEFQRGPWLLQRVPLDNYALWLITALLAAVAMVLFYRRLRDG